MSDYVKEAFTRGNMQHLREFILYGAELIDEKDEPYHIRLKNDSDPIYSRLKSLCQNEDELDKAHGDLSGALSAYKDVYMEIGMKIGAKLLYQLLFLDET